MSGYDQPQPAPQPLAEVTVQHTMPIVGSYVVFSIDVPTTLEALDHQTDPLTRKIAGELPIKKYVAYVEQSLTFDIWNPWHAYRVRLLSPGLPPRNDPSGIDSHMCVPVLPTTHHPSFRRALRPAPPLPWSNTYHYTYLPDLTFRVRTAYADPTPATTLPISDRKRLQAFRDADAARQAQKAFRRRRSITSTYYSGSTMARLSMLTDTALLAEEEGGEDGDEDDDDEASVYTEQDDPQDAVGHAVDLYDAYRLGAESLERLTAVVVSYDLTGLEDVADPTGFYEEVAQLMRLVEQAREGRERRANELQEVRSTRKFESYQHQQHDTGCLPDNILSLLSHRLNLLKNALKFRIKQMRGAFSSGMSRSSSARSLQPRVK